MLNVHTRMYSHNSQINVDHDILNIGHKGTIAKLVLDVFFLKIHDFINYGRT